MSTPHEQRSSVPRPPAAPAGASGLREVLDRAEHDGFDAVFMSLIDDDQPELVCPRCGTASAPDGVTRVWAVRLEGASDPADLASVSGLRCPVCGTAGVHVARYGPEAGPVDACVLSMFPDPIDPDRAPDR